MIPKNIEKVNKLQLLSYSIYLNTIKQIKTGMSEIDIASVISKQFKERGVDKFWYDVPIMVLIGEGRFLDMTGDYGKKSPSDNHLLKIGDTINVDFTPMDEEGDWGDFSATCVFHPKTDYDFEKVEFLKLVRRIQKEGIKRIRSANTGRNIAALFLEKFKENNITLVDVRNNVGHSMHSGTKKFPDGSEKRKFLAANNIQTIGEGIFAVEPSACRKSIIDKNKIVVGKFEDCIYLSTSGTPLLLAPNKKLPLNI